MLATSLAAALLLPWFAGGDDLHIDNARPTHGHLGPKYEVKEGRLPGDVVYLSFDIKNLKLNETGHASYSMLVEIMDAKGRPVYKLGPTNSVAQNVLGGKAMPGSAHFDVPLDTEPGMYLFRLSITDRLAKKTAVLEHKGKVLPPDFGLVRVATFADREGKAPAPPVGVVGETLYVHFATVGFARNKKDLQPHLLVTLRVLDDKGQPTTTRPLMGEVTEAVPENLHLLAMQFGLTLNRTGNFRVELEAHDKLSGKTAKTSFPLKVVSLD